MTDTAHQQACEFARCWEGIVIVGRQFPLDDIDVPVSRNVSLMELTDAMCKWPIGDPSEDGFHFCGHKSFNGLPYCEYHSRVAYQAGSDRRRVR